MHMQESLLQVGAPNLGSQERGHLDLFQFPHILPICSDLRSLFSGMPRFVPTCSNFFWFVFRTIRTNSADSFCKSPNWVLLFDCKFRPGIERSNTQSIGATRGSSRDHTIHSRGGACRSSLTLVLPQACGLQSMLRTIRPTLPCCCLGVATGELLLLSGSEDS